MRSAYDSPAALPIRTKSDLVRLYSAFLCPSFPKFPLSRVTISETSDKTSQPTTDTMTTTAPQIEQIPIEDFDKVFTSSYIGKSSALGYLFGLTACPRKDLVSSALGGKIIAFSDEFFASASNLINPLPPIRRPNTFTENGAWFDGWETRRHNDSPKGDWVVMRLGVGSGIPMGCEVDTAFFNGNHAPAVAVHGIFAPNTSGVPTGQVCISVIVRLTWAVGRDPPSSGMRTVSTSLMEVTAANEEFLYSRQIINVPGRRDRQI